MPVAGLVLLAGAAQPRTPEAAVAELLAADRAASAAAARAGMIEGLTASMASDVIMPVSGRGFADGVAAVRTELARDTLNATSRVEWVPVRGGISADGMHGFTFGFIEPNGDPPAGQVKPRFPFFTIWRRAHPGAPWRYVAE